MKKLLLALLLAVLVGVGYLVFDHRREAEQPLSSVSITHEYNATTTATMSGALIKSAEFNQLIASSTAGVVFGSVVVASTTDAAVNIYDASSTDAVLDGIYSILITRLSSSTPRGTYVYDIALSQGLVVQLQAGFEGDYVFTWRR